MTNENIRMIEVHFIRSLQWKQINKKKKYYWYLGENDELFQTKKFDSSCTLVTSVKTRKRLRSLDINRDQALFLVYHRSILRSISANIFALDIILYDGLPTGTSDQ